MASSVFIEIFRAFFNKCKYDGHVHYHKLLVKQSMLGLSILRIVSDEAHRTGSFLITRSGNEPHCVWTFFGFSEIRHMFEELKCNFAHLSEPRRETTGEK